MSFRSLLLDASKESESFLEFARTEFALDLVHFWVAVEESKQVRSLYQTTGICVTQILTVSRT
jgi:hypothetical protein